MVRRGVGVAIAAVVLAGCGGGTSDEEKVVAAAQALKTASQRHDAHRLCRELLHPNTVRAVERLARAQVAPGGSPPTCEEKYRTSQAGEEALQGRTPSAGAAIARDDPPGARRAVARLGPLDYRKSSGFNRLGLPGCARL